MMTRRLYYALIIYGVLLFLMRFLCLCVIWYKEIHLVFAYIEIFKLCVIKKDKSSTHNPGMMGKMFQYLIQRKKVGGSNH